VPSLNQSENELSEKYLKNSFFHFFFYAFSVAIKRTEGVYHFTSHLTELCQRVQFYSRTSTIAPRFHLKSTIIEAYVLWKIYRMEFRFNEFLYISYTGDASGYHTKKIKRYLQSLPELFGDYKDLTDSATIIHYQRPDPNPYVEGRFFYCEPTGIMNFKRGQHPHEVICDDILRDPEVKLDLSQLNKITRVFFEEIEQMPKIAIHCVGTPQDDEDLLSQLETKTDYNTKRYDAVVDEANKIAWWPELFPFDELMRRKERIGDKAFMKEFRCKPVRGVEGYISHEVYLALVNSELKNIPITATYTPSQKRSVTVGGFDIGKKTHPSHLTIFEITNVNGKDHAQQIHSKFMDGWDYINQIAYLKDAVRVFGIKSLHYDDTRAEFESTKERRELPRQMSGVAFTSKTKFGMAQEIDKVISNKDIEFLVDDRQKRQILSVDCNLKAPETQEGHGDAFFSLCLAVDAWKNRKVSGFDVL